MSAIDDLVDQRNDVGATDIGDGSLTPTWDELAPDQLLDRPGGPLRRDVAGNEELGNGGERARLLGHLRAGLRSLARPRINPILHLSQQSTGARTCVVQGHSREVANLNADRPGATARPAHGEEAHRPLLAGAAAEAAQLLIPNFLRRGSRPRQRPQLAVG